MQDSTMIKLVAISAIALLEAAAIVSGLDGAYFGPAIAVIGGIAGYELRGLQVKKSQTQEA